MKNIFNLLRINHWTKNLFVFAIPFFHGEIFNIKIFTNIISTFLLFCLVSSLVYIFNDIIDKNEDKHNLKHKYRPIASGDINLNQSIIISIIIATISFLICVYLHISYSIISLILAYLCINFFYTIYLKQIIFLEIFLISSGFLIRLYAGSFASGIHPSEWIIICTWLLSVFMIIGKRISEINLGHSRKVLKKYNYNFLKNLLKIFSLLIVISYIFYCIDPDTKNRFGNLILLTAPLVAFGIYYYLKLLINLKVKLEPTILIFKNKILLMMGSLWLLIFILIIYLK